MNKESETKKAKKIPVTSRKDTETNHAGITPAAVKKAKKVELVDYCKELGLSEEGHVDELRERLLEHIKEEKEKKPPTKVSRGKAKKDAEEEEEVEIEEEGAYVPKKKPSLSDEIKAELVLRNKLTVKRPRFLRQEWFRYKRLGHKWRKPRGLHSKMRRHFRYRINVSSIGYRGPRNARGLHSSGFREVLIYNPGQLEGIDAETQAVRIAHAVGMRKRKRIEEIAAEKGIRVLNRSVGDES